MSKKKIEKKLSPEQQADATKKKILATYITFVKRCKRHPTEAEMQREEISRGAIRWHFGSPKGLKEAARKKQPEAFVNILDETLFTKKNFKKLKRAVNKHSRILITTAVAGCEVHANFLKSLEKYCEEKDAMILVIPVHDPAGSAGRLNNWEVDPALMKSPHVEIAFGDIELNSNLFVSGIKMSAKHIDPTSGLDRIGQACSFIYGTPKMRLKVLPCSNEKIPHVAMGTGAITIPNYKSELYMSQRTAYLADFDHKLGAIVVELEKNDMFYFRQLQAEPKSGRFADLGEYYKPFGATAYLPPEAFVMGDIHAGEHDASAMQSWKEVIQMTGAGTIVAHDLFNGNSISHWEKDDIIKRAQRAQADQIVLADELKLTAKVVDELLSWETIVEIVIPRSNHDEFLTRYLRSGRFVKEPLNFKLASELAGSYVDEIDPVKAGVEKYLSEKSADQLRWLDRDEDFRVAGIECGAHGDKGPNGARGTLANHERAYGLCVIGHTHTPQILRDAWQVGTSTLLDLDYAVGPSSWMHTSCLIYPNGARQLIHSIRGKWKLKK